MIETQSVSNVPVDMYACILFCAYNKNIYLRRTFPEVNYTIYELLIALADPLTLKPSLIYKGIWDALLLHSNEQCLDKFTVRNACT